MSRPPRTLLRGGTIIDGSGGAPFVGDVLIAGERVEAVAPVIEPGLDVAVVEAAGREVLPGFIDVHSHDDAALFDPAGVEPKLRQGVTTTVIGNCGHGCAPSSPDSSLEEYSTPVLGPFPPRRWATFGDYLGDLASEARRINSIALVPHAPVRSSVLGMSRRAADERERSRIAGLVGDALDAGAVGLSFGLMYSPGNAADTDELTAIARAVAERDGVIVAHIRNEADRLLPSLDEFAGLARASGAAMHVSHMKVTGPQNFGRMPEVIARLDELRSDGLDVTADVYPYDAGSTTVATLFPSWSTDRGVTSLLEAIEDPAQRTALVEGLREPWTGSPLENYFASLGPHAILLAGFTLPEHAAYEGMSIGAIAEERGQDPAETLIELVLAERGRLTVVLFQTDIEGMKEALAWPWTLIGSDGLPAPRGYVHPRLFGTFPRLLTEYAGPGRVISRAEAVKRATRDSAHRFGLAGRAGVVPGAIADLQLLDPAVYADRATFESPRNHPLGLDEVYVRGAATTGGARAGRFEATRTAGRTR